MRAALARWLRSEAERLAATGGRVRILDVGCGVKPYFPFFERVAGEYVGLDVILGPNADVVGVVEDMPLEAGRFDLILCTQVLEHGEDPPQAIRSSVASLPRAGAFFASTHGVQVYHPSPHDYWRWTHEGLAKLFNENADWASLSVAPAAGTASTIGMLLATFVEIGMRRARAPGLARGPVWA